MKKRDQKINMKGARVRLGYLLYIAVLCTASGQVSETNLFTDVNRSVPDGTIDGVEDVRTNVSQIVQLTRVRVRLKITGNYNGDLYAYLRHASAQQSHLAVLLNRPGRTATNTYGYNDDGFDVVFDDEAPNDVHSYRSVLTPPADSPLTGEWQPDARFVDPDQVTTDSPRLAFLSLFKGMPASGEWTLFVADADPGGTNYLASWGVEFTGKLLPDLNWSPFAPLGYGAMLTTNELNASANVPGTFVYDPPLGTVLNAGASQKLSVTFLPDDTNQYVTATTNVTIDVTPQPLVITALSTNKTYGDTLTFTGTEFTVVGLVSGETLTSVTLVSAGTVPAATTGSYEIVPSAPVGTLNAANYQFTFVPGMLTVNPAALTGRANDCSRFYGQTNPPFTVIYSGFVNGQDASVVTNTLSGSSPATTSSPVGAYPITVGGQSAPNYSLEYLEGTLTVMPTPLLVAGDDASRAYGQPNPSFTATISGWGNGEDTNALSGTLVLSSPAETNSAVGLYPIIPAGLTATNYTITFSNGTLRVTAYALSVTASNQSRNYGAANPELTGSIVGVQNGDNISAVYATVAEPNSSVGGYPITISLVDPDHKLDNYSVTTNHGMLTVNPAALTGRANDCLRFYGQTNPAFTITYSGFVNGQDTSVVTGTLSGSSLATTNSPVGAYPISVGGQSAPNYSLEYLEGTLKVMPAPLLVAGDDASRAYGEPNPDFTATISGWVNGEDTNALGGTLLLSSPAETNSAVGLYPIIPAGLTATNYAITFSNGTLRVTDYALSVTASNQSRTYGAANPELTGSIAGVQSGDNISAVYATVAEPNSPVGGYPITISLVDPDHKLDSYSVTTNHGTLTVDPALLKVTADPQSRAYGVTNPALTASITGFVNGEARSVLAGELTLTTPAEVTSPPGAYPIVIGGLTSTNYELQFSNALLTITPAVSVCSVQSSTNMAAPGAAVTFSASLGPLPPSVGTPSGSVQFKVDGTNYVGPIGLHQGLATLTTASLARGVHAVAAEYAGDQNFQGATNNLDPPQLINGSPVAATVAVLRAASSGTKVALSYLLANSRDAAGDSVAFDHLNPITAAGGTAQLTNGWILYVPPAGFTGPDTFTYAVRDSFGTLSTGTININPIEDAAAAATLRLARLSNQTYLLQLGGIPWGTYELQYLQSLAAGDWRFLGMATLDETGWRGLEDTPPEGVPARFYRAVLQGGEVPWTSFSTALRVSATTVLPGTPLGYTFKLDAWPPGSATPQGQIQFILDGTNYGSVVNLVNSQAGRSTTTLPWGRHRLAAEYSGDANFPGCYVNLDQPLVIDTPPVAGACDLRGATSGGIKMSVNDLLALAYDADGEQVTLNTLSTKSAEGGNVATDQGWIFYTPPTGSPVSDSFTYSISDSLGMTTPGLVTIAPMAGNETTPNLTVIEQVTGAFRLQICTVPWRTYTLQYAPNRESTNWTFLAACAADAQGLIIYDDTLPQGTTERYYRALANGNGPTASPFRVGCWNSFTARTNGRVMEMWAERSHPAGWPNTPPVLTWNTNSLIYGLDGFTAMSPCNADEGAPGQIPGTLITRRHMLMRGHSMGENGLSDRLAGSKIWFCTASNKVIEMRVAAGFIRLGLFGGKNYDYGVFVFSADAPDSLTPISVISEADFSTFYYRTREIPYLLLGAEQYGHVATGGDPIEPFVFPLYKGGDSGSPDFIISPDNKLVMYHGRGISGFSAQLAADVDALTRHVGLDPNRYQLRWYDLSPWAP
jgi:subtilisin-like proprotein convertase family protein